jgi:hypothetical protein
MWELKLAASFHIFLELSVDAKNVRTPLDCCFLFHKNKNGSRPGLVHKYEDWGTERLPLSIVYCEKKQMKMKWKKFLGLLLVSPSHVTTHQEIAAVNFLHIFCTNKCFRHKFLWSHNAGNNEQWKNYSQEISQLSVPWTLRRYTSVRQVSSLSREFVLKVNSDHASSKEAVNLPKKMPEWNRCVMCSWGKDYKTIFSCQKLFSIFMSQTYNLYIYQWQKVIIILVKLRDGERICFHGRRSGSERETNTTWNRIVNETTAF